MDQELMPPPSKPLEISILEVPETGVYGTTPPMDNPRRILLEKHVQLIEKHLEPSK